MESINADSADSADSATEQEPNLAQRVDVQVEPPIPNPMFDVVTLEIKPFSSASKDNGVRDLLLWNQLWGLVSMPPYPAHVLHLTPFLQVRSQEQLPVDTTVCGAAVTETELDREQICTDQAACSERLGRRGKRKRKPKAR